MKPGKTNDYPRGMLNASDEGGLNILMTVLDNTVVLDFGTPVKWIGLDKETALMIGAALTEKANSL